MTKPRPRWCNAPLYNWLGKPQNNAITWRPGGHAQSAHDWTSLLDYADWLFFDIETTRDFSGTPHLELAKNWDETTP